MTRLLLLLVLAACGAADAETKAAPRDSVEWGLYQIHWGRRFGGVLERELKPFASKPDYVMFYRDLGRPFPASSARIIRSHGGAPIISLELWHWMRGRRKDSLLPAINAGDYDTFFRDWARAAKADGERVLLRFGFEMNGDWFSWSGKPKEFVAAWRRARAIFREEKAGNVEWVWAPNVQSCPDTPANDMHRYYPGDDHVDWVAIDGYNFGDHHDEWHEWESLESVFGKVLPEFGKRYPKKPLMLAETGCAVGDPGARAQWFRDAHAFVLRRPHIRAVVFFNYDKRRESEPNFRIDATPGALEAFNATFASSGPPSGRRPAPGPR